MMDIVERLRSYTAESTWDLLNEAADEIERLREALKNTYDQLLEGDLTEVFKTLRAALKESE